MKVSVNEACKLKDKVKELIEIVGDLVMIDGYLYLIDIDNRNDYKDATRIYIKDQNIRFVLMESIMPLGGESFVFHRAKISGFLKFDEDLAIQVDNLLIKERGEDAWLNLDLSPEHIKECKLKREPNEGFDFFKEMGDE